VRVTDLLLFFVFGVLAVYTCRHLLFVWSRVFGRQRFPYTGIFEMDWPRVVVFVPAHNEELVVADALRALLAQDYPRDRLEIIPVNDRSTDSTRRRIDEVAAASEGRIRPFHREGGTPGKAAALQDALKLSDAEIIVIFDADYLPIPGLLREIVAPFVDPEVGAVMGRVVPLNAARGLLARFLDLERSAGYQVDQQARMNLGLLPQYGGTVGGVRRAALEAVGGWNPECLAEDTDITFRLFLGGWNVVYQNGCECYEEVPESWPARAKQIRRWAKGHTQVLVAQGFNLLRAGSPGLVSRLDAFLLLAVYLVGPLTAVGWVLGIVAFYEGHPLLPQAALWILGAVSFGALGNFALFFQMGTAVLLDGRSKRLRLLPLGLGFFLVSMVEVTRSVVRYLVYEHWWDREVKWDKTPRHRAQQATPGASA
jgi:cellulose synthase/poly-beta-1,6-N-acetylglucosamine synthase-like glycosyltransferase